MDTHQAILECISDGILAYGAGEKVVFANRAAVHLLSRSFAEIVGCDIQALIESVDTGDKGAVTDFLNDEQSPDCSVRLHCQDKVLLATFTRSQDAGGFRGAVAIRDVTREVEMEQAQESLFGALGHELRTPLHIIVNIADFLQSKRFDPEDNDYAIEAISANCERLLTLAEDLLAQAQIDAGQVSARVEPLDPAELVANIQDSMDRLAQQKGIALNTHIASELPPTLSGDIQRLHQILVNLVSNALRFTDEGSVNLRIYLPDTDSGAVWAIEVSDTGCGIPEEDHTRIFQPFKVANHPTTCSRSKTGLGLSITKGLVEMMEGTIELESEIGQGSTFTVTLPLLTP
jgi:signal transduction histidine kinase